MSRFSSDAKYFVRMMRSHPGFALVTVLTLAFGIGFNLSIFSVVDALLFKPLHYYPSNKLVRLAEKGKNGTGSTVSYQTYVDWKGRSQSFRDIAVFKDWTASITSGSGAGDVAYGMQVSYEFFHVLGINPVLGRAFSAEDDKPGASHVVILSDAFWRHYAGADPGIIGKSILIGDKPYTVIGVLPAGFYPEGFRFRVWQIPEIWSPLGYDVNMASACRTCRHLRSIARLKDNVSESQARSELSNVETQLAHEYPQAYPPAPGTLVTGLQESLVGHLRSTLYFLLGAVGFLLLIVCANVANLFLVRATERRREIALRSSLGASRGRIVRQLLTEGLLMAAIGGTLGLLLASGTIRLLIAYSPRELPRLHEISVNGSVLLFAILLSLLVGAVFSLAPVLMSAQTNLQQLLRESSHASQARSWKWFQDALVVSELTLALVLMGGAGLLLKSFVKLAHVNPGFETNNLISVDISTGSIFSNPEQLRNYFRQVMDRAKSVPGVQAAALTSVLPISGNFDKPRVCLPQDAQCPSPESPNADRYFVSPDYIHTMHIDLLQGRAFTDQDDVNSQPVVLVNQNMAEHLLGGNAIGKQIRVGDTTLRTIVGVVTDVRQDGLDTAGTVQVYVPYEQWPQAFMTLVVRPAGDPKSVLPAVRHQLSAFDKQVPVYNANTMDEVISTSVAQRRIAMLLATAFGGMGLFLAGVGVYGVISYSVTRRTQEIGIRMALGAQKSNILTLILRHVMLLTGLGVVIGIAGSLTLSQVLESLLFDVHRTDAFTLISVSVVLGAIALIAGFLPARKATHVAPVEALRME